MSKKHKMEVTPIMALSMMTIGALAIPIFTIATNNQKVRESKAAELRSAMIKAQATQSPTPTASPKLMYKR